MGETRTWTLSGSFDTNKVARIIDGPELAPTEIVHVVAVGSRARIIPTAAIIGNQTTRRLCGNITRATLIAWRAGRGVPVPFPAPARRTDGTDLWDRREVRAWLRAHRPGGTA